MKRKTLYMKLFWESPLLTLLTFTLYTIFVVAILLAISRWRFTNYTVHMLGKMKNSVVSIAYEENTPSAQLALQHGLMYGDNIQNAGTTGTITGKVHFIRSLEVIQYGSTIRRNLQYPVSSGRWLERKNEIVLTHNAEGKFKLGEEFSFQVTDKFGKVKKYELEVVGFLAVDILFLNDQSYSKKNQSEVNRADFVIFPMGLAPFGSFENVVDYYGIAEETFEQEELRFGPATFLTPIEGVSTLQLETQLQDRWKNYAKIASFGPYVERFEKENKQFWKQNDFRVLLLFSVLLTIFLIFCNLYSLKRRKEKYSIFYMAGASNKMIVRFLTLKNYIIVILSVRVAMTAIKYLVPYDTINYLTIKSHHIVLASICILFVNFLITNGIYFMMKRKNPFRERWEN